MTTTTRKTPARPRPADDQPFDFNLDTVKREVDLTPFRVQWGGKRWEFAHLQGLDIWPLLEGAKQGDLAATAAAFEAALGPKQFAEFRKIPLAQDQAKKLFDAYAEHCGVDLGE